MCGVTMCISLEGMEIVRSYTPVHLLDSSESKETFNSVLYLIIKIYKDGAFTQHLQSLTVGESLNVCG